jgi:TPR repeat protein
VLAAIVTPALAQDAKPTMAAAETAYAVSDFKAALAILEALGNAGDVLAQHRAGIMLLEGKGAARDPVRAAEWIRRAAEQGQTMSWHMLGRLQFDGIGMKRDRRKPRNPSSRRRPRVTRRRN